ncbi:AprI/Inh family metalloprotease inhibitor [Ciceribacter ferrooxidans]|uniref:Alkaline proteinase inhibitor/ Outer membrane lipoprotein Omp19 domain-containing protein n=1 Tax=Ciceribacter ferrooxidans TaxID=2509717 RepID=A0A4Q2T5F8_9HYPH|nr:AprI/Inh family metalloprotease inhibitor [Ciceribacter ferrooxidans]RYC12138.1 hypothetical protein EUU22_13855 [Ciceribacter ferrooxidans]
MTPGRLIPASASRIAWFLFAMTITLLSAKAAGAGPEQFVGRWNVQSGGTGECTVELRSERNDGRFVARATACTGALASVRAWKPVPRGLSLLGRDETVIVTFEPVRGILFGRLVDGTLVAMRRMHD